jgi:transposase InsO family protein
MEEQFYVDRAALRALLQEHPEWTRQRYAETIGRSLTWVKKWVKRLQAAEPADDAVLWGLSRARKTPPQGPAPAVVERILAIRDNPPDNLQRTPGPLPILYYLHKDETLHASGVAIPRSTRTVWQVLDKHGRIMRSTPVAHQPFERPAPMTAWQIDFKDASTVPADPYGKQQHVVETFNVVDIGTSVLLDALPREDFNAETALIAMTNTLLVYGIPDRITYDRDPRFVGSWRGRDFPSAFTRFLLVLGIEPNILPPERPDLNAFVERYHRSYEYECLRIHRPRSLEQVKAVTETFKWHYNNERPNQAVTCRNTPPYRAHPALPLLPRLPAHLDPDRWLRSIDRKRFKRRVCHNGSVQIDKRRYYVGQRFAGRYVNLQVDADRQLFVVYLDGKPFKDIPIKGMYGEPLEFQAYLALICQEAISEWRRYLREYRPRWVTM